MTTLEVLKAARELITDPENWTTGAQARDSKMKSVSASAPQAVKFCAYGAINRVTFSSLWSGTESRQAVYALSFAVYALSFFTANVGVANINDGPDGHAAILDVFDKAIAHEQEHTAKSS